VRSKRTFLVLRSELLFRSFEPSLRGERCLIVAEDLFYSSSEARLSLLIRSNALITFNPSPRSQITTPDFLLSYATRSSTTASPPPTDISSSINGISSDYIFQYENGTDVGVHLLYARGTPSALFEGESVARGWAANEESEWTLELSVAETQYEDFGLLSVDGEERRKPVSCGVVRLNWVNGEFRAVQAEDKVEEIEGQTTEPSLPTLCLFAISPSKKKSSDPVPDPEIDIPLLLRLVKKGATYDPVLLLLSSTAHPLLFSSLSLHFTLSRTSSAMTLHLTSATCANPTSLAGALLLPTQQKRLPIYHPSRFSHFSEACARLLVNDRGIEKLLRDESVVEWLCAGTPSDLSALLESRVDAATKERLKMRRIALSRRITRLSTELEKVGVEEAEGRARGYWFARVGEDLRKEMRGGDWKVELVAETIREGWAKEQVEAARMEEEARRVEEELRKAVPKLSLPGQRNPLKERNALPRGARSPARKRSRLGIVDNENEVPEGTEFV